MHASVRERWETSRQNGYGLTTGPVVWNPLALKGFISKQRVEDSEEWEWVKDGIGTTVKIPELKGPSPMTNSFESKLRYAAKIFPKD